MLGTPSRAGLDFTQLDHHVVVMVLREGCWHEASFSDRERGYAAIFGHKFFHEALEVAWINFEDREGGDLGSKIFKRGKVGKGKIPAEARQEK
jgi:hypothetical protein